VLGGKVAQAEFDGVGSLQREDGGEQMWHGLEDRPQRGGVRRVSVTFGTLLSHSLIHNY
jgi:hypothetical protein